MALIDSLTAWAVTGGTSATSSAMCRAAAASSSRATTRFTIPARSASSAVRTRAHSRNSLARRAPSSHGSTSSSTPAPLMRSTGLENRASSAATIRSHMQASIRPAAEQVPCTAAMVGLRQLRHRSDRSQYMTCSWRHLPSAVARMAAQRSSPAISSLRSWPAEKCRPSAASTMTRTAPSASDSIRAASSSSIMAALSALAASGRAMVTVATGPDTA